jgi:hypothetical protein
LKKLGFPWILSTELNLFNGLREIFAGRKFSRPIARGSGAGAGVSAFNMQKRRIAHGASLAQFLVF